MHVLQLSRSCLRGLAACRKPKRGDKGKSAMQPVAPDATVDPMATVVPPAKSSGTDSQAGPAQPGSSAFAALAAQDVKAEDVFFHRSALLCCVALAQYGTGTVPCFLFRIPAVQCC